MNEQEEFFSKNHKRLLNIAAWAKYMAWVVLVIYVLYTVGEFISASNFYDSVNFSTGQYMDFEDKLKQDPLYTASLVVRMASTFLKGTVYFLVLKVIALGLNMIVETDINYREAKLDEVENE